MQLIILSHYEVFNFLGRCLKMAAVIIDKDDARTGMELSIGPPVNPGYLVSAKIRSDREAWLLRE